MGGKSTRVVVRCGASIQMGGPCTNIVTPIFPDIANLRCKHISPSSVSVY